MLNGHDHISLATNLHFVYPFAILLMRSVPNAKQDIHSIVEQLEKEIKSKRAGEIPKAELEKIQSLLYKAATDLVGKNLDIDSVRNQYNKAQKERQELTTSDQMERAAGVKNAPKANAPVGNDGYIRPAVDGSKGDAQQQNAQSPIATGQPAQSPTEENFQPWSSGESTTQGTQTNSSTTGKTERSEGPATQGVESPGQEQVDNSKNGAVTPQNGSKPGADESQSDYLAPGTMDEKKKKQDNSNHQESNPKEGGAGGKGSGSKNEAAPKSDHEMLGEQGSKIGADAVPNYPKNFSEAKDQVKQQLATKAADYIFDAVLEWVWTDLGIITIGVIGTFLLLLGHMFKVQLRPWQKWLIILYDVVVVGIIVFFVLPAGVVGTCLIDSSGLEICQQIGL